MRAGMLLLAIGAIAIAASLIVIMDADRGFVKESEIDVIVIAGQSNAEYMSERCDVSLFNNMYAEKPNRGLYYYGTKDLPQTYWSFENKGCSFNGSKIYEMWSDDCWKIGGYEPLIANEISKLRNNDVLVINTGVGGKNVSELCPDSIFGEYGFKLIDKAVGEISKKYSKTNMLFWMWIQGEADYSTDVDSYISDFKKVQSKFETYGMERCYIVHTRDIWGGNANIAQEDIAATDPSVIIVARCTESFSLDHGGCLLDEPGAYGIHYSCLGRIEISKSLLDVIKTDSLITIK